MNILITGSTSGIGLAAAKEFLIRGHNVIINGGHNKKAMEIAKMALTADTISTQEDFDAGFGKGTITPIMADVSDSAQVEAMFKELDHKGLLPDILVNNAGISHIGLLQDMSDEEWNHILSTNLTSVFNCCRAAIPHMLGKGQGTILNVSSMWGSVGASCEVAYSATKGAVNTFTKALSKELAPSHIQVNAVAFGVVNTRMNAFLDEEDMADLIDDIPVGSMCSPEEAGLIVYKLTKLPMYVTGQIIGADGGYI